MKVPKLNDLTVMQTKLMEDALIVFK